MDRQQLEAYLEYDPAISRFRWKVRIGLGRVGAIAGRGDGKGYIKIGFNRKAYFEHRLVWLYHYDKMPRGHLDHIDGNPLNNKISNLREATDLQNMRNQKKSSRNTSGYKGVSWSKRNVGWLAKIQIRDEFGIPNYKYLGTFALKEDAALAYNFAAVQYHGEFARIN